MKLGLFYRFPIVQIEHLYQINIELEQFTDLSYYQVLISRKFVFDE